MTMAILRQANKALLLDQIIMNHKEEGEAGTGHVPNKMTNPERDTIGFLL